ncbi:MAG: class IV adenylate cyclase [Pseudomonadota bacterium]
MKFEVEKKARLKDPAAAREALAGLGRFEGEWEKEDRYYLLQPREKGGIDMREDPIFRIRLEKGRCLLGAKKRSFRGKTEINEEVEIPAGDPEETLWFFEQYLGLVPFVTKHKRTSLFIVDAMHVEINLVEGLGCFLEVEIQKDKLEGEEEEKDILARIQSVFDRLGIEEGDIEDRTYIELLMEKDSSRL